MAWKYQTKYHKKGLTEQRRAKEEFVLKNYPNSDWAKAIRDQRKQVLASQAMEAELKNAKNQELRISKMRKRMEMPLKRRQNLGQKQQRKLARKLTTHRQIRDKHQQK